LKEWKPATTEQEAIDFLKAHHGVERVVLDAAAAGHSRTVAPGDRQWTSDVERTAHLNKISHEWNRIKLKYPSLPAKPIKVFINIDAERGYATTPAIQPAGPPPYLDIAVKGKEWPLAEWNAQAAHKQQTGRDKGVERQGTQVEDNFRHELGHLLTDHTVLANFQTATAQHPLSWFFDNVSEYAAKNIREALAEAFSLYTREDYAAGTLPAIIEAFFAALLGA
jgi:hypothetical protein